MKDNMGKKDKKRKNFSDTAKRIINLQDIKEHKFTTTLYIVLRIIIIAVFVFSIINGKWENTMTCFMSFVLLMIPSFIENKLKIDLPNVMETIMITFVFAANIMGEISAFYEKVPFWDTLLHTLNGFICAGVGFGLIDILNRNDKVKISLSPLFVCLFSFCFSMTTGTVWEFFEFGMDMLFGKDMQKDTIINSINSIMLSSKAGDITRIGGITDTVVNGKSLGIDGYLDIGLIDTMKDLLVNFIGAVVFNIAGYFYIKNRGKKASFISNFVPRRMENEKNNSQWAEPVQEDNNI